MLANGQIEWLNEMTIEWKRNSHRTEKNRWKVHFFWVKLRTFGHKASSVIIMYIFKRPGMQTACPLANPIIVDNFASLFNRSVWIVLRKIMNICSQVIAILYMVFFYFDFRLSFSPLFSFIKLFIIMCVSSWWFTYKIEDPYVEETYVYNLELH